MVLTDYDGTVVWQTNTSSKGADYAELMDSGNLVMKDQGGNILWQSFDHPTDTLLPPQSWYRQISHTLQATILFASTTVTFFHLLMMDQIFLIFIGLTQTLVAG